MHKKCTILDQCRKCLLATKIATIAFKKNARPERNWCTSSYTTRRAAYSRRCFTQRYAAKAWKGEEAPPIITRRPRRCHGTLGLYIANLGPHSASDSEQIRSRRLICANSTIFSKSEQHSCCASCESRLHNGRKLQTTRGSTGGLVGRAELFK